MLVALGLFTGFNDAAMQGRVEGRIVVRGVGVCVVGHGPDGPNHQTDDGWQFQLADQATKAQGRSSIGGIDGKPVADNK